MYVSRTQFSVEIQNFSPTGPPMDNEIITWIYFAHKRRLLAHKKQPF